MEPISTGFLGEAWGQLGEGRGTGCECEGSSCPPGAWVGDPRENLRCQRPICHPPRQAWSHLALETQQARAWLLLKR